MYVVLGVIFFFCILLWKTAPLVVIFGGIGIALWLLNMVVKDRRESKRRAARVAAMTPEEFALELARQKESSLLLVYGATNQHLICPHCQTQGLVRVTQKTINTVATGQIGGILKANTKTTTNSVVTQHHCCQCGTTWKI